MNNLAQILHSKFPSQPAFMTFFNSLKEEVRKIEFGMESIFPDGTTLYDARYIFCKVTFKYSGFILDRLELLRINSGNQENVWYEIMLTDLERETIDKFALINDMSSRRVSIKFWQAVVEFGEHDNYRIREEFKDLFSDELMKVEMRIRDWEQELQMFSITKVLELV